MSKTRIFHCLIVNLLICRGKASLPTAKHYSWVPESVWVQPKSTGRGRLGSFAKSLGQSVFCWKPKALRHYDVAVTVTKPASRWAKMPSYCEVAESYVANAMKTTIPNARFTVCFSNISQHLRCPQNCGRGAIFLCQWSERLQSKTKQVLAPPFLGDDTYWWRVLRNPFLVASARKAQLSSETWRI